MIAALARGSATVVVSPWEPPPTDGASLTDDGVRFWVVERDAELVGGFGLRPHPDSLEAGSHPWSPIGSFPLEPDESSDETSGLVLSHLILGAGREVGKPSKHLLTRGLCGICQRLGAPRVTVVVSPSGTAAFPETTSLEAYLQQVYFRAVEDPMLVPFLRAGFRLRGYLPDMQKALVVLEWLDVRHPDAARLP